MKILVACIHYPVASGRYITDAFKRLGHDVRHIGYQSTVAPYWGVEAYDRRGVVTWQEDGLLTAHWDNWTPDLVIVADSAWAYHHPVYQDVPHIVWGVDNHVRDYRQFGAAHYFLAHNAVSIQDMNRPDVTWLPCAADSAFVASPIPYDEREYDVALVGVAYAHRQQVVNALKQAGITVMATVGPVYDAYQDVYHNARIALSLSAHGDVGQRVFETARMGNLVVSDDCPDLASLKPQGIVTVKGDAELIDTIKDILAHPDKARKLIAKSLEWSDGHTWEARAQVVVDWYTTNYASKPIAPEPETIELQLVESADNGDDDQPTNAA